MNRDDRDDGPHRFHLDEGPDGIVRLTWDRDLRVTAAMAKQAMVAVDDVSLDIEPGDVYGIIGYSGAGKSTLIKLLIRDEIATQGEVVVDGLNLARIRRR